MLFYCHHVYINRHCLKVRIYFECELVNLGHFLLRRWCSFVTIAARTVNYCQERLQRGPRSTAGNHVILFRFFWIIYIVQLNKSFLQDQKKMICLHKYNHCFYLFLTLRYVFLYHDEKNVKKCILLQCTLLLIY